MSIQLHKLTDPRVDGAISEVAFHDAVVGSASTVVQKHASTSNSTSNLDFVIQTPGLGVYMNRRVEVETSIDFNITVTATATTTGLTAPLVIGQNISTNSFPFNSLIQSANVQINSSQITTQNAQIMPLMRRLLTKRETRKKLGVVPTDGQFFASCADDAVVPAAQFGNLSQLTQADDPFAAGGISYMSYGASTAPTAFGGTAGVAVTGNLVVPIRVTVREPLLVQPFSAFEDDASFINVQSCTVRLNLLSPDDIMARFFKIFSLSGNAACTLSSIAYATPAAPFTTPVLRVTYMSPPAASVIPRQVVYPYQQFTPLPSATYAVPPTALTVASPASIDLDSPTITLNTCPDYIAIYALCTPTSNANAGSFLENQVLLPISKVSIQWNNQASLLNTMAQQDLWRRSFENGVEVPYSVATGAAYLPGPTPAANYNLSSTVKATVGSPLLLAVGRDLPVEPGVAPGVAGIYTLRVTASVYSYFANSAGAGNVTLYVVPITSQYMRLMEGGTAELISSVATEAQIIEAPMAPERTVTSRNAVLSGAGWMSNFAKNAASAMSHGSTIANRAKQAYDFAKDKHSQAKQFIADNDIKGKALEHGGEFGRKAVDAANAVGLGVRSGGGPAMGKGMGAYDGGAGSKRLRMLM